MKNNNVNIVEIFTSIQGEGPYIGYKQVFVRFTNCNLNCSYCDTNFKPAKSFKVYFEKDKLTEFDNPVNTSQFLEILKQFNGINYHSLSLTGGEPLLNTDFLSSFLDTYKENSKVKIYLETNGTLPDELAKIINYTDIISMDIKLESSTGIQTPWQKHTEFAKIAIRNNKELFLKIVVTSKILESEIELLANKVKEIDAKIPVILQPITTSNKEFVPSSDQLMKIQDSLLKNLTDVRIIPQMHKYLGIL